MLRTLGRLFLLGALCATVAVAVAAPPAQAADNELPCVTQAEFDSIAVGTTRTQVRSIVDSPGARLTWGSPMKFVWKRCDGGGNGYAQIAFTQAAGDPDWRVSSKWYAATAPSLKRALSGLVVIDTALVDVFDDGVDGIEVDGTIKVTWAELEGDRDDFDLTPITSVLSAHPDTAFRVRIMAGAKSAGYLLDDEGECVDIQPDSNNGAPGCVPHFWDAGSEYRVRYQRLMRELALKLVGNQQYHGQVVDVVNSACTTIYAEPFILGATSASRFDLWEDGYTFAGHKECISWSAEMMTAMFPTTKISVDGHNKWQTVTSTGQPLNSWELERDFLNNELLPEYGEQLVLEDHGLWKDDGGAAQTLCPAGATGSQSWYCFLTHLHATWPETTYGFQFTIPSNPPPEDMVAAAELGVDAGGCYLETFAFGDMNAQQRRAYHQRLLDNCPSD